MPLLRMGDSRCMIDLVSIERDFRSMNNTSGPPRFYIFFWLLAGAAIALGIGTPEARLDGARLSQTVESLRQKTVELERELDAIKGTMDAQRRSFESKIREMEDRIRQDGERDTNQRATILQRIDSLQVGLTLAIKEAEVVRLEPFEDTSAVEKLYRILRSGE